MPNTKIILSKIAHSQRLKPFRTSATLILTTVMLVVVAASTVATAQTFTILRSFDGADGANPRAGLVQATNGNLYGTTSGGLNFNSGTVFKISPGGTLTSIYGFCSQPNCSDGAFPYAGLVQATDGNLYGTTYEGGEFECNAPDGCGTAFKITPSGKLTTLHIFCVQNRCEDGTSPSADLVQATDGNLYGTTSGGFGTVFKITLSGKLTTLHSFDGTDGANPGAGLVQATDGNLYGTTSWGGDKKYSHGTVFKMTPSGKLTTLYDFCSQSNCTDGANPRAGLVQATDGNFYGTTYAGGNKKYFHGTVFKMTPSGKLTTLYDFCSQSNCVDGVMPSARLVQATDGNFYGTTSEGGNNGCGTVFKITPNGMLTTLHSFSGTFFGCAPLAGLVQDTNGDFYGTTYSGGHFGYYGMVFRVSVGLGPFVIFVGPQSSGKVGNAIQLLGQGFTGTTGVSFNGTSADFTIVSDTYLTATVPNGATTGFVTVKTPGGTLTSNKQFRVTPVILSFSPTSGPVGTPVTITGNSFTGATKVTFGGVKATTFSVDSDTQITANVPTGAKTGKIAVTTPGGTATSKDVFTVTQ